MHLLYSLFFHFFFKCWMERGTPNIQEQMKNKIKNSSKCFCKGLLKWIAFNAPDCTNKTMQKILRKYKCSTSCWKNINCMCVSSDKKYFAVFLFSRARVGNSKEINYVIYPLGISSLAVNTIHWKGKEKQQEESSLGRALSVVFTRISCNTWNSTRGWN